MSDLNSLPQSIEAMQPPIPDPDEMITELQNQLRSATNQHFELARSVLKVARKLEPHQSVALIAIVRKSLNPKQEK